MYWVEEIHRLTCAGVRVGGGQERNVGKGERGFLGYEVCLWFLMVRVGRGWGGGCWGGSVG